MSKTFDWTISASYNDAQKRQFHSRARAAMRKLAAALELPQGSYDIRSNQGGIAVSGEITLHGEHVYIQAAQSFGPNGILFRRCNGRKDYTGSTNRYAPLRMLDNVEALAALIERKAGPAYKANAIEIPTLD